MSSGDASKTCLVSQDIRRKIAEKKLEAVLGGPAINESQIQPASFEPRIGNEAYVIDTERGFRPKAGERVRRTLLEMPARQRRKLEIDSENGCELKKGYTYLLPLEERVTLDVWEYAKSSPKSSFGRLFMKTRLLADFNPSFDEMNCQYGEEVPLNLWVLLQPLAFNTIVYPGMSFNQLRFFKSLITRPVKLGQLVLNSKEHPIFHEKEKDGNLKPARLICTDGLQIHLDLSGSHTHGVVGLRARPNQTPIDLKRTDYDSEEFFEPIVSDGAIEMRRGEYYLLSSKEVMHMPPHLNAVLRDYSGIGLTGPVHFAGFIDNGFRGDVVFEVRSDELSSLVLDDGAPISALDIFETVIPDKIYGDLIGSNYQGQTGPQPAKFFRRKDTETGPRFDFAHAAREYKRLARKVLVQDSKILRSFRRQKMGFEPMNLEQAKNLFKEIERNGFFHFRYDCETDQEALQIIPYILIFGPNRTIFSYVRAKDIKDYGDERLFSKHSIGVGGHISTKDNKPGGLIANGIKRELEEEVNVTGEITTPKLVGTLYQPDVPVDQVHFGLIYRMFTDAEARPREASIISGRMVPIDDLVSDPMGNKKYETWSKYLIPHLNAIHDM